MKKFLLLILVFEILIMLTIIVAFTNHYEEYDYYIGLALNSYFVGGNFSLRSEEFMEAHSRGVFRLMSQILFSIKAYRIEGGEEKPYELPMRFYYSLLNYEVIDIDEYLTVIRTFDSYLDFLLKYLEERGEEFIVEALILHVNKTKANKIVKRGFLTGDDYVGVVIKLFHVKDGNTTSFTIPAGYCNALIKFSVKMITPELLLYRLLLVNFSPLFLTLPLILLIIRLDKRNRNKTIMLAIMFSVMIVVGLSMFFTYKMLKGYYEEVVKRVHEVRIHQVLVPLGFCNTVKLELGEVSEFVDIELRSLISESEYYAIKRVCSHFNKTNVMVMLDGIIEELMELKYLNVTTLSRLRDRAVLVSISELRNLVIRILLKRPISSSLHTYTYIYVGVPVEAYDIITPPITKKLPF